MRGATTVAGAIYATAVISIRAPLAGSDQGPPASSSWRCDFNPRSPCGERLLLLLLLLHQLDFNPRSPCGERLFRPCRGCLLDNFNPRAPCGERQAPESYRQGSLYFNPRSPCGERRRVVGRKPLAPYFNPRSPCGERPSETPAMFIFYLFQSALPLRGATIEGMKSGQLNILFQSALPLRGATRRQSLGIDFRAISIRAPLAGSDSTACGARAIPSISIRAPLAGSDLCRGKLKTRKRNFNPRSPCGERRRQLRRRAWPGHFNPRSPCGERRFPSSAPRHGPIFQSALPLRGATPPGSSIP